MASVVLGAAGAAIGAGVPVVGGVIGRAVGQALGSAVGGVVDNALFGTPTREVEGHRLADISVQASTYGRAIPLVYGSMRLAGNVIWSLPIREVTNTTTSGGGKGFGGGGVQTRSTTYSYYVTLAIAIGEGRIDGIRRAWADAAELDMSQGTYRIYYGDEDQLPDSVIESVEGIGQTPAYRGLAYVVIEDFPLADYGNRIPNFTFEITRSLKVPDYQGQTTEEMIRSMTLIPGAGEFVYDTIAQQKVQGEQLGIGFAQSGVREPINDHTPHPGTNVIYSLDQLQDTCPNLEWISLIVTWFGDDLNAGQCKILPAVEYQQGATTTPNAWQVAGFTRDTARQITLEQGNPRYGGTPDDASVVRLITECQSRGLKVMLYPMFFMDTTAKPWRGRVTGTPTEVADFFTKADGYNRFILHYATLAAAQADAFVIGSELIGLTRVHDASMNFPAVDALRGLANDVRQLVGSNTLVTYAADWSEYHHTDGGWYHLDPLWASPDIDMIGIDAYFPLTNAPQTDLGYDVNAVIAGWDSGEGYDFYYIDGSRTITAPLGAAYAWKNLEWFWNNTHINPDGQTTPWVPQSKKIWFTEYGFPSVDGATNQPNVFYDPASSESFFPRFSRGQVDIRAQRTGITATEARWNNSPMLDRLFLWTWDARPYPYFPDLINVWADGGVWATGHWVTGKFNISGLAAIIRDLCIRAGMAESDIDVSRITTQVTGYVITRQASARTYLEELMQAYFIDAVESDGVLTFVPRGTSSVLSVQKDALVREPDREDGTLIVRTREQEADLPYALDVLYLQQSSNYQTGTAHATRQYTLSRRRITVPVSLVLSDAEAYHMAQATLNTAWAERVQCEYVLDESYSFLEPTDVITVNTDTVQYRLRITNTLQDLGRIHVQAVAEETDIYREVDSVIATPQAQAITPQASMYATLMDLPALPGKAVSDGNVMYVAATSLNGHWRGAVLYKKTSDGVYVRIADIPVKSVMGRIVAMQGQYMGNRMDYLSSLDVRIIGDESLYQVTQRELLNGANVMIVGDEVLQFAQATLLEQGKYRLSTLLRGRLGTEHAVPSQTIGQSCVLLSNAAVAVDVPLSQIGQEQRYKVVGVGQNPNDAEIISFTYRGRALQPYAPVHLNYSGHIGEDMVIDWVRRDRLYGEWRNLVGMALSETREAYRLEIYADGLMVRSVDVEQSDYRYDVTAQTEDGVTAQSVLQIKLCQLSSQIGCGVEASLDI